MRILETDLCVIAKAAADEHVFCGGLRPIVVKFGTMSTCKMGWCARNYWNVSMLYIGFTPRYPRNYFLRIHAGVVCGLFSISATDVSTGLTVTWYSTASVILPPPPSIQLGEPKPYEFRGFDRFHCNRIENRPGVWRAVKCRGA